MLSCLDLNTVLLDLTVLLFSLCARMCCSLDAQDPCSHDLLHSNPPFSLSLCLFAPYVCVPACVP